MDSVTFSTNDVEHARVEVGRILSPHRLTPQADHVVTLRLAARKLGDVGVVDLDYGGPVRVQPEPLSSFYLVQMPYCGSGVVRHAGRSVFATAETAVVISPQEPFEKEWSAGTPHRLFYVQRSSVERELQRLLGHAPEEPVRFELGASTTTPQARAWRRGVDFFAEELAHAGDSSLLDHPSVARRFEEALVGQLLVTYRHNYSDELSSPAAHRPPSRLIRRACALIQDHHTEPLTVGDVAEALAVSVRTLQEAFRRELDSTPMAYLRACRLDAVRRELRAAESGTSVTSIALAHGFVHMGRFASEYRTRFGESPSTTLRG
ncbi:AraC family transcriptional regulator [Streptomyces scabiei]|jgi:AraC-like DNA-binding protein|nr:AraC family transcriptional regulator [Streptomyces sp. LBUM 1487]QTU50628.1 AraC family transcriptional regulator [Streptomyces sp. LBUM 1482]